MMAGGIHQFHESLGSHLAQLRKQQLFDDGDDGADLEEIPPISFHQMEEILFFCLIRTLLALLIFVVEIIRFRLTNRSNRRITPQPRHRPRPRCHTI